MRLDVEKGGGEEEHPEEVSQKEAVDEGLGGW